MKYDTVIGLEVHVELSTRTKVFCGCPTDFGAEQNTQCCPICTGMPGTLPVLNEKVLEYAIRAGLALNCEITRYNKFDRKNYFYPDLPKAYQISQLYLPLCRDGKITLPSGKAVGIHEIHIEEDAGKLIHAANKTYLDYNRCGVPLIEIVTRPDMTCAEEAIECLTTIKSILEYLEISDCQMQEGSLRADVNLSVKPAGSTELGTRTEMKNINSFKAIERAIAYEKARQVETLESGGEVSQETRRWDDGAGESYVMRSKEDAHDYRYFPDPDIPPLSLDEAQIKALKKIQPEFAAEKAERFVAEYNLSEKDAAVIVASKKIADLFETVAKKTSEKETAAWVLGELMYLLGQRNMRPDAVKISTAAFADFINAITSGTINRTAGKQVFEYIFDGGDDVSACIERLGLAQTNDEGDVIAVVQKVLAANEKAVAEYRAGKQKSFTFLVGQTMKEFRGKGNPALINKILKEQLDG